jgi:hypothetical protein
MFVLAPHLLRIGGGFGSSDCFFRNLHGDFAVAIKLSYCLTAIFCDQEGKTNARFVLMLQLVQRVFILAIAKVSNPKTRSPSPYSSCLMEKLSSVLQEFRHMLKLPLLLRLPSTPPKEQQQQQLRCADSPVGDSEPVGSEDGSRFFDGNSQVWNRYPDVARYNPPRQTLPLPFCFYGQPFYKGFSWETKV